jgi:hypothetical protein
MRGERGDGYLSDSATASRLSALCFKALRDHLFARTASALSLLMARVGPFLLVRVLPGHGKGANWVTREEYGLSKQISIAGDWP